MFYKSNSFFNTDISTFGFVLDGVRNDQKQLAPIADPDVGWKTVNVGTNCI